MALGMSDEGELMRGLVPLLSTSPSLCLGQVSGGPADAVAIIVATLQATPCQASSGLERECG